MAATLRVSLSRESLVYNPGETIQGKVEILNQANTTHAGLSVRVQGNLHLVPGGRDQGKQEQVITLLSKTKQILAPGKILGARRWTSPFSSSQRLEWSCTKPTTG